MFPNRQEHQQPPEPEVTRHTGHISTILSSVASIMVASASTANAAISTTSSFATPTLRVMWIGFRIFGQCLEWYAGLLV